MQIVQFITYFNEKDGVNMIDMTCTISKLGLVGIRRRLEWSGAYQNRSRIGQRSPNSQNCLSSSFWHAKDRWSNSPFAVDKQHQSSIIQLTAQSLFFYHSLIDWSVEKMRCNSLCLCSIGCDFIGRPVKILYGIWPITSDVRFRRTTESKNFNFVGRRIRFYLSN